MTAGAFFRVPTGTDPNLRLVVDRVTGVPPVPVRLTVCGLFGALSNTSSVAVRVPVAAGVNVTLMVQLPPAGTLAPQVLLGVAKSPGSAPLKLMLLMFNATLRLLISVTVCAALVVPTVCSG